MNNIIIFDHLDQEIINCSAGEDGDDDNIPWWISLLLAVISGVFYFGTVFCKKFLERSPVNYSLFTLEIYKNWFLFLCIMFLVMTLFLKNLPITTGIFISSVVLIYFLRAIYYTGLIPDEKEKVKIKSETIKTYKPRNLYQDLSASRTQVIFIFLLQSLLTFI